MQVLKIKELEVIKPYSNRLTGHSLMVFIPEISKGNNEHIYYNEI